jgi:hypothetical protein
MTTSLEGGPIRLVKTAFVIYHHVEYEKALKFLDDFGLKVAEEREDEVFLKGYGTEPFVYICRKATNGKSSFGRPARNYPAQQTTFQARAGSPLSTHPAEVRSSQ